jgi:nucleoside 2-deoxyribosyltransferase
MTNLPPRPRIYCASKLRHAPVWRQWKTELHDTLDIVSTWHDNPNVEVDEADSAKCYAGWHANRMEILHAADFMLVFGMKKEPLNGTLIEVGMAIAMNIPTYLVGDYPWGTWRYMNPVVECDSLHTALTDITGALYPHNRIGAITP